jgi:ABC-2 type transport system permease protein
MKDVPAEIVLPPQPRAYHGVNWAGLQTLYLREVRRFIKVGMQTLAAPVVTALLYMLVFVVAVGGGRAGPP